MMDPQCSSTFDSVPRFIDNGHIELCSEIGRGAYGVVFLAIDSKYGAPVYRAVKCLKRVHDERQRHFQRREIALHRLASSHSSIVAMDRLIEEGNFTYVVMDFGEGGDLFSMITERQRYVGDDELIRSVFLQLLDGVAFLHSLGIAHRDVKPENIVCSADGERVRICDFGLATSETSSNDFGCGSSFYIAPECLGDWNPTATRYATRAGDVWSLGVILVNLVSGRNPWRIASPTDETFNSFLRDPSFLRRIIPISHQCLFVLTQIFTVDPAQRISLRALRKLILEVDTFSMGEEELRIAHAVAQVQAAIDVDVEVPPPAYTSDPEADWEDVEGDIELDDLVAFTESTTPSLRGDSISPSPPHRSRSSSSNGGSLPPTPLLSEEGSVPLPLPEGTTKLWESLQPPQDPLKYRFRHRRDVSSPDHLSATQPNPFFVA